MMASKTRAVDVAPLYKYLPIRLHANNVDIAVLKVRLDAQVQLCMKYLCGAVEDTPSVPPGEKYWRRYKISIGILF